MRGPRLGARLGLVGPSRLYRRQLFAVAFWAVREPRLPRSISPPLALLQLIPSLHCRVRERFSELLSFSNGLFIVERQGTVSLTRP
jgi:hypothetical protein